MRKNFGIIKSGYHDPMMEIIIKRNQYAASSHLPFPELTF